MIDKEAMCIFFWQSVDKCLRLEGKLLQDLAESTGIKYQTITSWRTNGRLPDLYSALLIAEYLGVTIEFLSMPNSTQGVMNKAFNGLLKNTIFGDSEKMRDFMDSFSADLQKTSELVGELEDIAERRNEHSRNEHSRND